MSIISYKKEFIFIHNPKVAGRSIRGALGSFNLKTSIGKKAFQISKILNIKKEDYENLIPERFFWHPRHSTAWDLKNHLSKETFKFFKFAFVRNPWDWHVSMYHFMRTSINHPRHEEVKRLNNFEEFLEWWIFNGVQLQKSFVTDPEGNTIVDFIGKFESLEKDFYYVIEKIGIKSSLPHINKTIHKDFRSYYNPRTIKLIKNHLAEDIEFFNYKFK